jgi:hypothetical protein
VGASLALLGAARREEKGGPPNRLLGPLANHRGKPRQPPSRGRRGSAAQRAQSERPARLRKSVSPQVVDLHPRVDSASSAPLPLPQRTRPSAADSAGRTGQRLRAAQSARRRPNRQLQATAQTREHTTGQTEPNTFFAFRLHAHPHTSQSASVQHSPKPPHAFSGSISTFSLHDGLLRAGLLTQCAGETGQHHHQEVSGAAPARRA